MLEGVKVKKMIIWHNFEISTFFFLQKTCLINVKKHARGIK